MSNPLHLTSKYQDGDDQIHIGSLHWPECDAMLAMSISDKNDNTEGGVI